ncbi:MAG: CHAT domain-containing tetratricopeptide repeat protein [Pseudomonadota bacterium]
MIVGAVKKRPVAHLVSIAAVINESVSNPEKLMDVVAELDALTATSSFRSRSQRRTIAEARRLKAIALYYVGEHPQRAALNALRAFMGFKRNGGTLYKQSLCANFLGMILWSWKGYGPSRALEWFEIACQLAQRSRSSDIFWKIETLENLGLCCFSASKPEDALKYQRQALKLLIGLPRTKDDFGIEFVRRRILRRIANIQQEEGQFTQAASSLMDAKPPVSASADEKILWHNSSGKLALKSGGILAAELHFDQAIFNLSQSVQDVRLVSAVFSNSALLKLRLGKHEAAEDLLEQMSEYVSDSSPLSARIGFLRIKAEFEEWQEHWPEACEYWHEARLLVEREASGDPFQRSELIRCEARNLLKAQEPDGANHLLKAELLSAIKRNENEIPLHAVGLVADVAKLAPEEEWSAAELLAEAVSAEAFRGSLEHEADLFAACATVSAIRKNTSASVLFGKLWLSLITDEERIAGLKEFSRSSYYQQFARDADQLIGLLIDDGRHLEAGIVHQIQTSEEFRQFAFRNSITNTGKNSIPFSSKEIRFVEKWKELKNQGLMIGAPIGPVFDDSGRNEVKTSARKLIDSMFLFKERETFRTPVEKSVFEKRSGPSSKLSVRYVPSDKGLLLEAKKGAEYYSQLQPVSRVDFNRMVSHFRSACGAVDGSDQTVGHELHEILLAPILKKFPDTNRIDLTLGKGMESLPFAALFDGRRYLCETHQISICSDAAEKTVSNKGGFFAFGAPAHDLPAINRELELINQVVPEASINKGAEFTKKELQNALSNKPSHLHFSGHFDLMPGHMEKSCFTLGDGNRLSLLEILEGQFDFRGVQCVALSGCNTAVGDGGNDSFQNLARLLICKGVRNIIGSLWKVHDGHAADFMNSFYQNFYKDGKWQDPRVALHLTQMSYARRQRDQDRSISANSGLGGTPLLAPYAWCGFAHFRAK